MDEMTKIMLSVIQAGAERDRQAAMELWKSASEKERMALEVLAEIREREGAPVVPEVVGIPPVPPGKRRKNASQARA